MDGPANIEHGPVERLAGIGYFVSACFAARQPECNGVHRLEHFFGYGQNPVGRECQVPRVRANCPNNVHYVGIQQRLSPPLKSHPIKVSGEWGYASKHLAGHIAFDPHLIE